MTDRPTDPGDPYIDPATGVLKNLLGARTREQLEHAEVLLVEGRAFELAESPVPVTGDFAHLQAIHRHLFQDVYGWAGQPRQGVDISKPGGHGFLPVSVIPSAAEFAFGELAGEGFLRGLDRSQFIERVAHHYDQINYLHPFREGNGRTQRVFWAQIADQAGHPIDWSSVPGPVNDAACRAAIEHSDLEPLRNMFARTTLTDDSHGR